jgi:ELWxxDGT repeat protein
MQRLWKTDGTPAGTSLVTEVAVYYSDDDGFIPMWTNVGNTIYFVGYTDELSAELWKTDGTPAGTSLVKDIGPDAAGGYPHSLTNVNGTLYFKAYSDDHGFELWKSDGTAAGTVMVKDIRPSDTESYIESMIAVNNTLYFVADDGTHGNELWKSDGTEGGTVMVKDINPADASSPSLLTNANGILFFRAYESTHGYELWKSDGTAAGTVMVKDIRPGAGESMISEIGNVNGTVYLSADDGVHGAELWKSNGTPEGTVLVKDINAEAETSGSSPYRFTDVNGILYFSAFQPGQGYELYKSDGTTAGTVLVKEIASGDESGDLSNFTNINGLLYFTAYDEVHGHQLWMSKGTECSTMMITNDVNRTVEEKFILLGSKILANVNDSKLGYELFSRDISNDILVKPVVTADFSNPELPKLTSSAAAGNQWFRNDQLIAGATASTFQPTSEGIYTVKVSDACESIVSDPVNVIITGIGEEVNSGLVLYPNPSRQNIRIELPYPGVKHISIRNVDGRIMHGVDVAANEAFIDVSGYAVGVYVVSVQTGTHQKNVRFIKK